MTSRALRDSDQAYPNRYLANAVDGRHLFLTFHGRSLTKLVATFFNLAIWFEFGSTCHSQSGIDSTSGSYLKRLPPYTTNGSNVRRVIWSMSVDLWGVPGGIIYWYVSIYQYSDKGRAAWNSDNSVAISCKSCSDAMCTSCASCTHVLECKEAIQTLTLGLRSYRSSSLLVERSTRAQSVLNTSFSCPNWPAYDILQHPDLVLLRYSDPPRYLMAEIALECACEAVLGVS